MNTLDLFGTMIVAVGPPVIVGTLLLAAPIPARTRILAAIGFGLWLASVITLGAVGIFSVTRGFGTFAIGLAVALPMAGFAIAALASRGLREVLLGLPIVLLVAIHTTRFAGSVFFGLYAAGRLPAPFAPFSAWGDVAVAAAAPLVAWYAYRRQPGWYSVTFLWSILGALDLIIAVMLGMTSSPDSPLRLFHDEPGSVLMGELPWIGIPAFLVPLLISLHVVLIYRLRAEKSALASGQGSLASA